MKYYLNNRDNRANLAANDFDEFFRPFDKKLYRPPPGDKLLITGHFLLMALFRDL